MKAQIVELPFPDLNARSNQTGALVPVRLTRASSDAALVESWLATFDPIDSAKTLVLYRRVSSVFLAWLSSCGFTLGGLTTDDLSAWRDQLKGAPATRSNRLAVVKSLLSYAHMTGYLRFNVGRAVQGPKVDADADSRSLTEVEVGLMIMTATTLLRTERARIKPRCRFIQAALTKIYLVRFLYYSACRVSEAVSVTWADFQSRPDGDFQLSVMGKGRKRRKFPLPSRFVDQLNTEYRPEAAPAGALVFSFGARRAQTIISALAKQAGLDANVSCHWLRHAAATHALDRGAAVHVVQQTLGHSSLATTTRYSHKRSDGVSKYLPRL